MLLPPRVGVNTEGVTDFKFDAYGRLITVIPGTNGFAITDPVIPTEVIITQRIIGGAIDGTSHNPGDFSHPRGVAIDPRNQEIYITDTGLNRVQVFDNQGQFIRMFGTGVAETGLFLNAPTAIEVDSFGNVFIAVTPINEGEDPTLVIVNEFGEPISYGSIEGYVKDKQTGITLDNVIVSISSTYRQFLTVTNDEGFFRFSAVPQGSHTLIANRDGYRAQYVNVFVNGGEKSTTTIYLERTGTGKSGVGDITGTLISSLDGDPIRPIPAFGIYYYATIKGLGITNTVNSVGEFRLDHVPEGDHVLQILRNSDVIHEQDVHVNSDQITPLGYIYLPI